MKAYMVHDGEPSERALLVFAGSGQEARRLGNGVDEIGSEGFLTVRANRRRDLDRLRRSDRPYVEHDRSVLRQAGWRWEGSSDCAACDLNGCDDLRYEPCGACGCCPECGHAPGCPEDNEEEVCQCPSGSLSP